MRPVFDGHNDALTANALDGDDVVEATGLAANVLGLTIDGGAGADVLIGSAGNDTLLGGLGDDILNGEVGVGALPHELHRCRHEPIRALLGPRSRPLQGSIDALPLPLGHGIVRRDDQVLCPKCGENHLTTQFSTFSAHANGKSAPSAAPSCGGGMCRTPGLCGLN